MKQVGQRYRCQAHGAYPVGLLDHELVYERFYALHDVAQYEAQPMVARVQCELYSAN